MLRNRVTRRSYDTPVLKGLCYGTKLRDGVTIRQCARGYVTEGSYASEFDTPVWKLLCYGTELRDGVAIGQSGSTLNHGRPKGS